MVTPPDPRPRTPAVVHVIGFTWACLLLLWAVVLPALDGVDELAALDLVIDATETSPLTWQAPYTDPIDGRLQRVGAQIQGPQGLAITAEHSTWQELQATGASRGRFLNQRSADPPLGYRVIGYGMAVFPTWQQIPLDRLVAAMRLLSMFALLPLPWILARAASVINGRESVVTASAAGVFTMPGLAVHGTSVGTGALMVLMSALTLVLFGRLAVGEGTASTARRAGVLILITGLLHPFGLALLIGLAGVLFIRRRAGDDLADLVDIAGWTLLPVLAAGWWFVGSLLRFGSVQPIAPAGVPVSDAVQLLALGAWGQAGEAAVPVAVAAGLMLLLVIASMGAVVGRGVGALLLLAGPALVGAVVAVLLRPGSGLAVGDVVGAELAGLAGEGLLVGLPGVLVLVAVGLQRGLPPALRVWGWVPPLAAGLALHGLLLVQVLNRRWAAGPLTWVEGLARLIGRSNMSMELIAGMVVGLLGGLFVLITLLANRSRRLVIVDGDS